MSSGYGDMGYMVYYEGFLIQIIPSTYQSHESKV